MKFEEIYNQVKDLKGWMGESDCRALHEYASKVKGGLILEIGSFMGISTKVLALSSPKSTVISIDPYLAVHPSSGLSDPEYVREEFLKATKGLNIKQTRAKSQDVEWNDAIDFLHIDGDHHYKAVVADIEKFVPFVKSGGYVFFHDYTVEGVEENGGRVKDAVHDNSEYFSSIETVSGFACCKVK